MEPETAQNVLNSIAAGGLVVWIVSVWFVSWAAGAPRRDSYASFDPEEKSQHAITGATEIEGRPDELATRATSLLASGKLGLPWGPARILERSADRITFEVSGATRRQRGSFCGSLRFETSGAGRTLVRHEASAGRSGLIIAARVEQGFALVVLVGLYLALAQFVVYSPDPAVRAQSAQMAQIVHLLWPPFLFAGLERGRRRMIRTTLETFASNLPYVQ